MSDLISRSELLKRFTFNSDGKRIPEYDVDNFPTTVSISTVKSMIREMPTAFDLDKVIAELEQERDKCYEQMEKIEEKGENETDYFDGHIFDEYHNQGIGLNKAIEIIKKYLSGNAELPKTD